VAWYRESGPQFMQAGQKLTEGDSGHNTPVTRHDAGRGTEGYGRPGKLNQGSVASTCCDDRLRLNASTSEENNGFSS
jgi:hypothetical protein